MVYGFARVEGDQGVFDGVSNSGPVWSRKGLEVVVLLEPGVGVGNECDALCTTIDAKITSTKAI